MERLKSNAVKYLLLVLTLLLFSVIKYLLIPKIENYEVFSYVFGGGLILYALFQAIIYLIELVFKMRRDSIIELLISFVLLEILLYLFLHGSLVISLFDKDDVDLFLLYQVIPVFVMFTHYIYAKLNRRTDETP